MMTKTRGEEKKKISYKELTNRLKKIKLLALDVDGVLTDDHIYFGPDGFEMKRFNISDGFFMALAIRSGLEIAIVSGRPSPATATRMKDLGIKHVLQKRMDKRKQIAPLLKKLGICPAQVAFVGNELLDIGLAKEVGLSIAVADAADELKQTVDYITKAKGGRGAVREIIRAYFEGNKLDPKSYLI
jgi:3-deoxy-D-manno-octulosonate 8-phosphate phosphatase (KDO 8-P phosphatase)